MRILLVEDELDLGAIIERTLVREKYVVDWVTDGETAWTYLQQHGPQYRVGIFDWLLPCLSGIELCQRLRAAHQILPILLLTAKDQIADRVAGLDAGADDYLVKPFSNAELLARLRALQRRSPQWQPAQLQVGHLTLDYATATIAIAPPTPPQPPAPLPLTAKEFQLLEYFMQHPQQILSRDQILEQVWSIEAGPGSNVVAAQIRLLRRKLAEAGAPDLIETIYGLGYRLTPPPDPADRP